MGEGVKAGFAVVGTHTALPNAAKAHVAGGQMEDHIIEAASAKGAEGGDLGFHVLHELIPYAAVAEDIVGSHTGLTAVEILAEHDSSGGKPEICTFVYNAEAFAAQCQSDWSEVRDSFSARACFSLFSASMRASTDRVAWVLNGNDGRKLFFVLHTMEGPPRQI